MQLQRHGVFDGTGQSKEITLDGTPTQTELNALITDGSIAKCD
jgi:hypothetical protein